MIYYFIMKISNQIKRQLSYFPYGTSISFKELRVKLNKEINVDSFRKALHRLHEQGIITIHSRGHFMREEKFEAYLFVYGSLKKGFDNHIILKEANYISKAKTLDKFAMYKDGDRNYPYIVKNELIGQAIEGELYQIRRKDILKKIDDFEDAPRYFKHENIWIKTRSKKVKATTYVLSSSKSSLNQKPLTCWVEKRIKIDMNFDDYYKSILG